MKENICTSTQCSRLWTDEYRTKLTGNNSLATYSHHLIYKKVAATSNSQIQLTGINALATYGTIIYNILFTLNSYFQMTTSWAETSNLLLALRATSMSDMFGRSRGHRDADASLGGSKSPSVGIATVFLMFLFAFK
ncbi:hypothetical protein CEK25_008047 [Fusarium fujikuroi]|nr:hypothetical protein CEK25_008047 [Fusarium fujikuroi]